MIHFPQGESCPGTPVRDEGQIPQSGGTESYPGAAFEIIINKAMDRNNVSAGHTTQNTKNEKG